MEKKIIERLHLLSGEFTKEKYLDLLNRLWMLDLKLLKRFYVIYQEVGNQVKDLLLDRDGLELNIREMREEIAGEIEHEEKIKRYLVGRMLEEDMEKYIDDGWKERLGLVKEELNELETKKLIEIGIYCHTLENLIDALIMQRDEYWMPRNRYTLYLLKESGFSFEKEKERIWQPPTN